MLGNPQAVVQAQDEEAVQEDPNAAWIDRGGRRDLQFRRVYGPEKPRL